jgi:uncharacterized damage-inducible protein DinB
MQPMTTIRRWQIEQLMKAENVLHYLISTIPLDAMTTARDGENGWTTLEVLGHLRDYEGVFIERARLTLTQNMPDLPFPEPNKLAQERDYNADNPTDVFAAWREKRRELLDLLQNVQDDQWLRVANHPTRGHLSLQDQVLLIVWHDLNHFEQIAHIQLGT